MKHLLIILLLFTQFSFGQQTVYRNPKDSSQNYYILTPPKDAIKGLLVLNSKILSDSSQAQAYNSGICTLTVVPTARPLENLMDNKILDTVDKMIGEVMLAYKIPLNKMIIGGMSVAGTGAIRYAEYCYSNKSHYKIRPSGVFGVDPPLDYERLYNEADKAITRNYNKDAVEESNMLVSILSKGLKGTPKKNKKMYQASSPFCYSASNGGNAYLLNHVAVRLYTEPDINWWIQNRRKDYYDLNCIDDAALVNQLLLNGNKDAELITTSNKGVKIDGHPHSWSIVDQQELILWCSKIFDSAQ